MVNKFIHTLEACWLCLRFPFLYPRNRFSGRHQAGLLRNITYRLKEESIQFISVSATQEKGDTSKKFFHKYHAFLNYRAELKREENKVYLWKYRDEKNKREVELTKIIGEDDKFEILGSTLVFSIGGYPIIQVNVKVKDPENKQNYGFLSKQVEFISNKRKYFWYKVLSWIDKEILDRIFFIPTFTELDAMEPGWRKAFGIQLCKELRRQLIKEHKLFKYRITQIKEKWGYLHWYDFGGSSETFQILQKYEHISYKTCKVCGKPATKLSGGWICPYCDEHFPENRIVYQELDENGEWKVVNENYI